MKVYSSKQIPDTNNILPLSLQRKFASHSSTARNTSGFYSVQHSSPLGVWPTFSSCSTIMTIEVILLPCSTSPGLGESTHTVSKGNPNAGRLPARMILESQQKARKQHPPKRLQSSVLFLSSLFLPTILEKRIKKVKRQGSFSALETSTESSNIVSQSGTHSICYRTGLSEFRLVQRLKFKFWKILDYLCRLIQTFFCYYFRRF